MTRERLWADIEQTQTTHVIQPELNERLVPSSRRTLGHRNPYTRNISPASGAVSCAGPLRFGEMFDQRLGQLVREHVGIRETARRLNVDIHHVAGLPRIFPFLGD